jgi:hypothetical protein
MNVSCEILLLRCLRCLRREPFGLFYIRLGAEVSTSFILSERKVNASLFCFSFGMVKRKCEVLLTAWMV